MNYRPEIDGLRALAVVPVVFFHAGLDGFAGGFVGVDVFFVISGYLITSIILKEKSQGNFRILNFYERRARRILPALFFVMLACIPFAWIWMAPHQLKDFAQSLVATTFFSSNIFFFLETDYFNEASELSPLLHTWSLAVEEQYYLFFPPFILLTWSMARRKVILVIALLLIASLVTAQISSIHQPAANFYLLHTRAWEILIGVLIAFHLSQRQPDSGKTANRFAQWGSALGLLLIAYGVLTFDETTPFPSLWALFPTIGTALVILFASPHNLSGRLLCSKPLVAVGLFSYSLYLWHQPLFAFARIKLFSGVPTAVYMVLIATSCLLAYLSYKYVEAPFRNRSRVNGRILLGSVALYAVLFPSLGLFGHVRDGFIDYKIDQIEGDLKNFVIKRDQELENRQAVWRELLRSSELPFDSESSAHKLLILGDSKSQDLFVSLTRNIRLFPEIQVRRMRFDNECMRAMDSNAPPRGNTTDCNGEADALLQSHLLEEAETLVLTNTWTLWTNSSVVEFVDSLPEQKRVYVLSTGNFNDLTSLSMQIALKQISEPELGHFLFDNIKSDAQIASLDLRDRLEPFPNVSYLEKLELFCDLSSESCELFSSTGTPYIYDTGHVTVVGADEMGRRIHERGWLKEFSLPQR